MSSNNRKRKYRQGRRSGGGGRREYESAYEEEPKEEQFLAHHQAYLSQIAGPSPSTSTPGGGRHTHSHSQEHHHDPLQALYIQAYEADIVRGPRAIAAAESLEVVEYRLAKVKQEDGKEKVLAVGTVPKIGSALIRWGGDVVGAENDRAWRERGFDEDEEGDWPPPPKAPTAIENDETAIWVDRYDARLLLDALPKHSTNAQPRPSSPTGWSDLPSDAEDTFFLNADEVEDFRREKRRRLLDQSREERLKARIEEDGDDEELKEEEDAWGGSDEEPDDVQKELMKRTATHLISTPNAAQLEMRILANHGGDKRFAFLRGRWRHAWNLAKARARKEKEEKEAADKKPGTLGILEGYGSDESESASGHENEGAASGVKHQETLATSDEQTGQGREDGRQEVDAEAAKEARRKRLKAWTEQRKVTKRR